jgi:hypothetical protein
LQKISSYCPSQGGLESEVFGDHERDHGIDQATEIPDFLVHRLLLPINMQGIIWQIRKKGPRHRANSRLSISHSMKYFYKRFPKIAGEF